MPFALLDSERNILATPDELTPLMETFSPDVVVAYNPPEHDPELVSVTPVVPVPVGASAVEFVVADIPADVVNAGRKAKRAKAYAEETDALFFKSQRGEIAREEWLAAVDAVKQRFPYI